MPKNSADDRKNPHPNPLPEYRARETVSDSLTSSPLNPRENSTGAQWAISLLITLVTVTVFGYFALRYDGTTIRGNELSQDRAFFATVNAVTLTGFQTSWPGYNEFYPQGKITIAILTFAGAMTSLIVGGLAVTRILRLRFTDRAVALSAVGWTIALTLVAGSAMLIGKHERESFFDPFFRALSAFANSGLNAGRLPDEISWTSLGILMPLAILGGLGLPALMEISGRVTGGPRLSRHVIGVLCSTAVVFLLAMLTLTWLTWPGEWSVASTRETLATATLRANNARGPGFAFEFTTELPRVIQWVLIGLMIVGGAGPAGTAGGIKSLTLSIILRGIRQSLRGEAAGRVFGFACVWAILYAIIVLMSFLMLLTFQPQVPTERLLFLAISAVSNVGLSHEPVSIVGEGLYVLSAAMVMGKLVPLGVLWWMALTVDDADSAIG